VRLVPGVLGEARVQQELSPEPVLILFSTLEELEEPLRAQIHTWVGVVWRRELVMN
jgi:hypothetical protein